MTSLPDLAVVALLVLPLAAAGAAKAPVHVEPLIVVRPVCYDGDTCTIDVPAWPIFFKRMPVRLRGLDAPEIGARCEAERVMALRARARLRTLVAGAKRLDLVAVERDKYFRLLATMRADGVDIAAVLIGEGLARHYSGGTRTSWCP